MLDCAQEFSAEPRSKKRRLCQYHGPEPSVEEIEGEFWRIVETPDEVGRYLLPRICAFDSSAAACLVQTCAGRSGGTCA